MRMLALLLVPLALAAQTAEKEAALGKSLAAETERRFDVIGDADVAAYLSRIGARVAAAAGYRGPLAIRVIKETAPRNTVFPGGYVFVSSGMIGLMSSEAELAGVLAHDFAHLVDPNTRIATSGAMPLRWFDCVLWDTPLPGALRAAAADAESVASRDAVHTLAAAGYDPAALPDLYGRLPKQARDARSLREYVRASLPPAETAIVSTGEFARMQQSVAPQRRPPSLLHPH